MGARPGSGTTMLSGPVHPSMVLDSGPLGSPPIWLWVLVESCSLALGFAGTSDLGRYVPGVWVEGREVCTGESSQRTPDGKDSHRTAVEGAA